MVIIIIIVCVAVTQRRRMPPATFGIWMKNKSNVVSAPFNGRRCVEMHHNKQTTALWDVDVHHFCNTTQWPAAF